MKPFGFGIGSCEAAPAIEGLPLRRYAWPDPAPHRHAAEYIATLGRWSLSTPGAPIAERTCN